LELYRLLLAGAKMTMPTVTAQQFMRIRVKAEFRKNMGEQNSTKIKNELTRAYNVIMAIAEQERKLTK